MIAISEIDKTLFSFRNILLDILAGGECEVTFSELIDLLGHQLGSLCGVISLNVDILDFVVANHLDFRKTSLLDAFNRKLRIRVNVDCAENNRGRLLFAERLKVLVCGIKSQLRVRSCIIVEQNSAVLRALHELGKSVLR